MLLYIHTIFREDGLVDSYVCFFKKIKLKGETEVVD
jgi:hypothetical protein